tara:strand:- start:48 stop:902 length:855 start_codon:yes stop_codon:yes gene_type:complete
MMETKRRFIGDPQTDFGPQMTPAFEDFVAGVGLSDYAKSALESGDFSLSLSDPETRSSIVSGLMDTAPAAPNLLDTPFGSLSAPRAAAGIMSAIGGPVAGFIGKGLADVMFAQGVDSPFAGHRMAVTGGPLDFVTQAVMEQHLQNYAKNPDSVYSIDGEIVSITENQTPFGLMRSITGNFDGTVGDIDRRENVADGLAPDTGSALAGGQDGKGGYDLTTGQYVDRFGNTSAFGPMSAYNELTSAERAAVEAARRGEDTDDLMDDEPGAGFGRGDLAEDDVSLEG